MLSNPDHSSPRMRPWTSSPSAPRASRWTVPSPVPQAAIGHSTGRSTREPSTRAVGTPRERISPSSLVHPRTSSSPDALRMNKPTVRSPTAAAAGQKTSSPATDQRLSLGGIRTA